MTLKYLKFICKKKLLKINPLCTVLVIFILLLYYEGYLSWLRTSLRNEDIALSTNSEFVKAKEKIQRLTSLLKRFKVPEELYTEKSLPIIYVITPTYTRPVQKAELTRLKNVFLHVPALHWIVVEDAAEKSQLVEKFLASSGIPFTHLSAQTPTDMKLGLDDPRWRKPRGVLQRNEGIKWLRNNVEASQRGVVYFADDDNTYSIELFQEMRFTEKVSVWPVGLVGKMSVERPSVNALGVVDGWLVGWRPDRPFATDMAGFAVNLGLLLRKSEASFTYKSKRGFMETDFIELLIGRNLKDLEPKADRCTQVLVWHTQTLEPQINDNNKLNPNIAKLEV